MGLVDLERPGQLAGTPGPDVQARASVRPVLRRRRHAAFGVADGEEPTVHALGEVAVGQDGLADRLIVAAPGRPQLRRRGVALSQPLVPPSGQLPFVARRQRGQLTADGVGGLGVRVLQAEKEFNRKAGFTKQDDRLPRFFYEEPLPPHNTVFDLSDEELDSTLEF